MKMKKIFLTSAVALALLSSCNNDYDGQDIAGTKLAVSASIDQVNTRLSDSGSEWTEGDAIGVSDNLSNPNLNIKYVAGSAMGDFTSTTGIIF
jgi:predicted small secreted protein